MSLALPFQTAKQLAAAVRKKKIGCLELLDLYLKRVEAYNPELNAIIATDIEGARKRAKAADRAVRAGKKLGPLHGVPMTIKESFNVAGLPTTWGFEEQRHNAAHEDALPVQRLASAGDGVFGAQLSPLANGTVVEFYVQATDVGGRSRTWPAPTNNSGAQGANCLYQVDTETWTARQPMYRLISTGLDEYEFAPARWNQRPRPPPSKGTSCQPSESS